MFKVLICTLAAAAARPRLDAKFHGALNQLMHLESTRRTSGKLQVASPGNEIPELFHTQVLDHFSSGDARTWKQRYFVNWEYYQTGGPVFLMIGGEGPIDADYVGPFFATDELAKKFGAAQVVVEHRFYGKSQPFSSLALDNLQYLTSKQALADLAAFTDAFNANLTAPGRWFCFGGSYPGSLAAWYRASYPDRVTGCVASSAPVLAKTDFYEYGEVVWRAMASGGSEVLAEKLHAGYSELADAIRYPTLATQKELLKELKVCPLSVLGSSDKALLEEAISTALGSVVQYNNSMRKGVEYFQDIVKAARNPLEAALQVSQLLNATVDPSADCADFSLRSYYEMINNVSLEAAAPDSRSWLWQTCNEFGYFMTMHISSLHAGRTMYTTASANPALFQGMCEAVFGISEANVQQRVLETNARYGGRTPNVSRVLFTNGEYDPWAELSIKELPEELKGRDVHSIVIERGSHCAGLSSNFPGDPPMIADVHRKIAELFVAWGATDHMAGDVVV